MLSIIGLVCTTYISVKVDGQLVTPRDFIILFSALVYGPVVGTPVALVLGSGRFVVGGIAAVSCAISCVTALALGSVLWYLNRGKAPDMTASTAMMFFLRQMHLAQPNNAVQPRREPPDPGTHNPDRIRQRRVNDHRNVPLSEIRREEEGLT